MAISCERAADPPLHVHHGEDESFVVLEGEVAFFLAGAEPQLVLGTPGGAERFFREMSEQAPAAVLPVPQPPDVERVVTIAAAHDIEILPPPSA